MTSTTAVASRPKRPGFSRSQDLRRSLGDRLMHKKCKKKPRDAAAEPSPIPPSPRMRIFMRRPSKALDFRFPDTEFFTHDRHHVRYTLLRLDGRQVLWVMSGRVLREKCPRWLRNGRGKTSYRKYDDLNKVKQPDFRALRTIVSLLHGGPQPTPDLFDSPFVDALVHFRDRLDVGSVVNPWIQSLFRHLCRDGGRYIVDLPGWPLLMPVCARFKYRELFDLVCRRFIRKCQVDDRNVPHCRGVALCAFRPTGWYLENFLHQRQVLVDEVLAFLQTTATNFSSMPKGHSKQSCARVIAKLLEEYKAKTSDGRFATTRLEQIVDLLAKDASDTNSPYATSIQSALRQVAMATDKIINCRVSKTLFLMI